MSLDIGREAIHAHQRAVWDSEWQTSPESMITVPGHNSVTPSSAVVKFADFLEGMGAELAGSSLVDIGCGVGRNAIYFASLGVDVTGTDYSYPALESARRYGQQRGTQRGGRLELVQQDLVGHWPFADNSFDLGIDSLTSTSVHGAEQRAGFAQEALRVLRPGAHLLVRAVSMDDETESELMRQHPGPESGSSIWPESGKFQKNFERDELVEMYRMFDLVTIVNERKRASKLGRDILASNWWMVVKKSESEG